MGHHSRTWRRYGVLAGMATIGLGAAAVVESSCLSLHAEVDGAGTSGAGSNGPLVPRQPIPVSAVTFLDGGVDDAAVVKAACSDDTERLPFTDGVGVDISSAGGKGSTAYTPNPMIAQQAQQIVSGMNIAQLANQMRGTPPGNPNQFNDIYRTADDPVAMIKGFEFRDGPRGVCLNISQFTGPPVNATPINYGPVGYSTTFPVSSLRAATWDLNAENRIGEDIGDEMLATGNTIVFAPVVNILRHPAWGRSQETYGEDSFLLGRMGSAFVEGVQEYIPACVKHFLGNNIERGRQNLDAEMDEQTLHEVYGRAYEMIVQDAGVACVMAAYNKVNGVKSTLNQHLLIDTLRNKFGFKGFTVSDFWAMPPYQETSLPTAQYQQNAQMALAATLDMEMPWSLNYQNLEAVATKQQLEDAATRIIEQKLRFNVLTPGPTTTLGLKRFTSALGPNGVTNENHLQDAEQVAEEGMVLLKNANATLPIDRSKVKTIAVIGAQKSWHLAIGGDGTDHFATDARLGDRGSSRVFTDPSEVVGPAAGIQAAADENGGGIKVVSGTDPSLADGADFVVVVTALTWADEGEDYTGASDRDDGNGHANFELDPKSDPGMQDNLVTTVAAKGKPMVVVNESGSAVNMPWLDMVPAVVQAWYPGAKGGIALGRLLFGDVSFSGKLPITWPTSQDQLPQFNTGSEPGMSGATTMDYYLGYRYFDKNGLKPLFPFGYGLSYTTFRYDRLDVPCSTATKDSVVDVGVTLTNTGSRAGSEVTFLFVSYPQSAAPRRSVKELKGFFRTPEIPPGETVKLTIPLRVQDLKYWSTDAGDWVVESGPVDVMVGGSSDALALTDTFTVQ